MSEETQRILIADTETTDVDHTAEIVELAFLEVDENLNILSSFESLVKPKGLISPAASGASGITNRMVADAPSIEEVLAQFPLGHFNDIFIIAHNCQFDRRMLRPFWTITGVFCTLRAARELYPESPNHKLQTLRYYLELDVDGTAHRALADILTTHALILRMMEDTGHDLQTLIDQTMAPKVVTTMPFGKHQGTQLSQLPRSYIKWLLDLPNLDDDLRRSLEAL